MYNGVRYFVPAVMQPLLSEQNPLLCYFFDTWLSVLTEICVLNCHTEYLL
jgi:hypothetical protein